MSVMLPPTSLVHQPPGARPLQAAGLRLGDERSARRLCTLVVQAFLSALPEEQQGAGACIEAPTVRVLTVAGLPLERSFTMPGGKKHCIYPTPPLPHLLTPFVPYPVCAPCLHISSGFSPITLPSLPPHRPPPGPAESSARYLLRSHSLSCSTLFAFPSPSQASSWTFSFRPYLPRCCRRADAA